MKKIAMLSISLFILTGLFAQPFTVPEVTPEQKTEILYNHVMGYFGTGIAFAKTQGVSPLEYGKFIGEQFKPFWNPEQGFPMFANQMMFMLNGMHPDNEMQILEQSDKMIRFKMKNVDLIFQMVPNLYGMTYQEMLDCSLGIIGTIAEHMGCTASHKVTDEIWYELTIKAK